MTTVKVATANPVKIEAIKNAFERYFEVLEVLPFEVESGVPAQPINDDVFKGAQNRIEKLEKVDNTEWDFLVSCEGGLICQCGYWFNLQVVQIVRRDGKTGVGLSQGYQIPSEYVEEVCSTSIAKLLDRLFEGKGGVSVLTHGQFNRKDLIESGTVMALTRVLNDVW